MSANSVDPDRIRGEFDSVFARLSGLPAGEIEKVSDLIQYGEWAIAFENLCSQLYEYEVHVDPDTAHDLSELGSTLGVEARYWEVLT